MYESKDEIEDAVTALMAIASQFVRGQTIPWEAVEAISGPRNESRGQYVIQKWRRRLEREREIVTLCPPTIGVRLLTHRETAIEIPRIRQRKMYRQARRALRQTSTVDLAELPLAEQKALAAQRKNLADQRRMLYQSRRQLERSLTPTEANPRRAAS